MFVRNGAMTPGLSRECDITVFAKGQQYIGGAQGAERHRKVIPRDTRILFSEFNLRFPP